MSIFSGVKGFEEQEEILSLKKEEKRVRYEDPTYLKFYSIYQYDRLKFRELMNDWLNTEEGQNRTYLTLFKKQKEILEQCYMRDENGNKIRDCDEKYIMSTHRLHFELKDSIWEYKSNQGIYERLYFEIKTSSIELLFKQEGTEKYEINKCGYVITIHPDEKQAEIKGSELLSIEERIKLHLKLLRKMRKENV